MKSTFYIALILIQFAVLSAQVTAVAVQIICSLEGFYDESSTEMSLALYDNSIIPIGQPFSAAPFHFTTMAYFNYNNPEVVDWILIEARDANEPSIIIGRKAALLQVNGIVVDVMFNDVITLEIHDATEYRIAVHHLSHLSILSNDVYSVNENPIIDFTEEVASAMGNDQQKLIDGKAMMYAGDFNNNGVINASDFNLWLSDNAAVNSYLTWDADGNGIINVADFNLWFANRAKVGISEIQFPNSYCQSGLYDCTYECDGTLLLDECGICDGNGTSTYYEDLDDDGLGNPDMSANLCEPQDGFVSNDDDDDDSSYFTDCPPITVQLGPNSLELVPVDLSERGPCNETLPYSNAVTITTSGDQRIITSNSIPDHDVGLFGGGPGSLNPNAIGIVNDTYAIDKTPTMAGANTLLLSPNQGPQYQFGILLNGVILDPEAAEPWPHQGFPGPGSNWEWNLDAMIINLGLDCNNAHVQPNGKYHHHGTPTLYLESLNLPDNVMAFVGYAADGFPIYFQYGHEIATDGSSTLVLLSSSYALKSGERPGDGDNAPCGVYNGVYTNDWEYISGLGDLDECNGRTGVTPEYPDGTYYYVITSDEFPFLPRCLKGSPSNDF